MITRRRLLKSAGAAGAVAGAGLGATGFGGTLGRFAAHAADVSGYKALVCVFLRGGLDCHDTLLPYDQPSYNRYAEIREPLLDAYRASPDGDTRARSALLPLAPADAARFGARRFALPPQFANLHQLFTDGRASIAANVGPLLSPIDRDTYRNNRSARPSKLFSHNDQQSTWMSLAPEGARFGWGGRFADAALAANANVNPVFTSISVSGNDVFLSGETANPYQIGAGGAQTIRELNQRFLLGSGRNSALANSLLEDHFRDIGRSPSNLFERDVATVSDRAVSANSVFNDTFRNAAELTTPFPDTGLADRLKTVAETIRIRNVLNVNRQVFFVSIGGFDTHSGQVRNLPRLQTEIDGAVAAFYRATEELGVQNDVTLFTASDFGRTLVINGDGTDHGWGGHQFIVGGAVNGGRIFGDPAPYDVDHNLDSGRGRLIPSTSIEQFAAPLGRWFGLNDAELAAALPRLPAFSAPPAFV